MEIRNTDEGRQHLRELIVDGQAVSRLVVIDYDIRVGGARLKMGGIAGVKTDPEHRMKGYSRYLLENTTSYMQDQGHDIALLFGIPDYYHKFGYASCLAEPMLTIGCDQKQYLAASDSTLTIREANESDLPLIIGLYNVKNDRRTFTLVRYPEYFRGFPKQKDGNPIFIGVLEDKDGFCGYYGAYRESGSLVVPELECVRPELYRDMLAHLMNEVEENGLKELKLLMPVTHPFITYLHKLDSNQWIRYNRCKGGMGRVINQKSALIKLCGEFGRRLSASRWAKKNRIVHIKTDIELTELEINNGLVDVVFSSVPDYIVEMPQFLLLQLIAGYRSIYDMLVDGDVTLSPGSEELLDTLFPVTEPYVWLADHF